MVEELVTKLSFLNDNSGLIKYNNSIDNTIKNTQGKLDRFNGKLKAGLSKLKEPAIAMGTAFVANIAIPIQKAKEFENAFKDVAKSVNGTDKEIAKLKGQLKGISGDTGVKFTDLTTIASDAGKMGIEADKVAKFTEVIAKASSALDLNQSATVSAIGKILSMTNQMDAPIKNAEDLANKIAILESKLSGVNAGDVIDVWKRLSGTFNEFNFDNKSMGGISAYLMQINTSSELASSGFKTFLTRLKTLGMADTIKTDGIEGLKAVLKDLGNMDEQTRLKKLGSVADEVFVKMSNLQNLKKMDLAINIAGGSAGAVDKEFDIVLNTLQNKQDRFKNSISNLVATVGTPLANMAKQVLDAVLPIVNTMTEWASKNEELVPKIAMVIGGLTALIAILATVGLAISGVTSVVGLLVGAIGLIASPIGIVIGVLAGLGIAWGVFGDEISAWVSSVVPMLSSAWEQIKQYFTDATSFISESISNMVNGTIETLSSWGTSLSSTIAGAWDGAKQVVSDSVDWIMNKVNAVVGLASKAGDLISKGLSAVGLGGDDKAKAPTATNSTSTQTADNQTTKPSNSTPTQPTPTVQTPKFQGLPQTAPVGAVSNISNAPVTNNVTNAPIINISSTNASPKEIEGAVARGMTSTNISKSTSSTRQTAPLGN